jgi:hypothetical protein
MCRHFIDANVVKVVVDRLVGEVGPQLPQASHELSLKINKVLLLF